MSGPINRPPIGLLGFLGLKSLGEAPDQLPADVRGIVDLVPWWSLYAWTHQTVTVDVAPGGLVGFQSADLGVGNFVVPPGEVWLVTHFVQTQNMLGPLGDILECGPAIGDVSATARLLASSMYRVSANVASATNRQRFAEDFFTTGGGRSNWPYLAQAGSSFGMFISINVTAGGGPSNITTDLRFIRFSA